MNTSKKIAFGDNFNAIFSGWKNAIEIPYHKILVTGLLLVILTLFFPTKDILADYIYLKDGSTISGILVEDRVNLLIYRVPYGEMFINRENINKIIHETGDRPLIREAKKYFTDRKFKRAIKACGEVLEINPDSREALDIKERAVYAWKKSVAEKKEKVRRQREERGQIVREQKKGETTLKTKYGIAIRKEKNNYIIADVYDNCPLTKGEIKPGDTLAAVYDTEVQSLSIKKVYELLLRSKKTKIIIKRPVVLTIEEMLWRGTKKYVGLGISIEKIDNGIKITNLMPNGPAAKVGVLKGDIIVSLKGRSISSSSMDDIIKLLKGSAGTKLNATIKRELTF